jgi:hypothetical protein
MTDIEATVQALEARVKLLEDQLALYRLISAYGLSVDSGSGGATASLWTEEGVYDFDSSRLAGRAEIAGMVASSGHQSLIRGGAAHVMAMPMLRIDGDTATATGYSRVYRREGDGFGVWRVSANRWEFVRGPDGWHATSRVNHVLDGSETARAILRRGVVDGDPAEA